MMMKHGRESSCVSWARRRAYSLIELVVVLAILAGIMGTSWPVMMRQWSRGAVQEAAQQLRQQILDTRTRATEESRVYRLQCRPGTGEFRIEAAGSPTAESTRYVAQPTDRPSDRADRIAEPAPNSIGLGPQSAMANDTATGRISDTPEHGPDPTTSLEHGVRFGDDAPSDEPTEQASAEMSREQFVEEADRLSVSPQFGDEAGRPDDPHVPPLDDLAWATPIWFYPDGRTSNGHWTLVSDEGYEIDLQLRGLTGTVRVGPIRKVDLPADLLDASITTQDEAADTVPRRLGE